MRTALTATLRIVRSLLLLAAPVAASALWGGLRLADISNGPTRKPRGGRGFELNSLFRRSV